MGDCDTLQSRLDSLINAYVKQLPERVDEIQMARESVRRNPSDIEGYEHLRLLVHKLAGSGATFGFDLITEYGRNAEKRLNGMLKDDVPPAEEEMQNLDQMLEALEWECMNKSGTTSGDAELVEEPDEDENGAEPSRTVAVLSKEPDGNLDDLADQVGFFGFSVTKVTGIEELQNMLDSGGIAVIHTNCIAESDQTKEQLSEFRRSRKNLVHFIFISDRSDFHVRLWALRSGGEAFFVLPVEVSKLVDSIEKLTEIRTREPYHVLIVDDDPEQVSYYALLLQKSGMITSVASDPMTVLNILAESKPELILMDMYMPGCSGTELLSIIRQQEAFVGIPVVFLSVEGDEQKKLEAIRQGGDDFITKPPDPEFLTASIANRVERTRSVRYFMERDSLTGLLNHTNLREQMLRETMRAERAKTKLCFAMIDLDNFKSVNDSYGHLTGDNVLKGLSRILEERLRRTDIIGRYGGEEFGVILINTELDDAATIMDEIRENFSKVRHQSEIEPFHVTFSCGIAEYPSCQDVDTLTDSADRALYAAKNAGRNRIVKADS